MKKLSAMVSLLLSMLLMTFSNSARSQESSCGNISFASLKFSAGSAKLTPDVLEGIAVLNNQMHANPNCRVVVMGNGHTNKVEQQLSWDRVNAVIEYMSDVNNVDRNRFIFKYGEAGPSGNVDYRAAGENEEGPSSMAPPHPDLRH